MTIISVIILTLLAAAFIFTLIKFLKTPKEKAEERENAKTNLTIAGLALTAALIVFGGLYFIVWLFTTPILRM